MVRNKVKPQHFNDINAKQNKLARKVTFEIIDLEDEDNENESILQTENIEDHATIKSLKREKKKNTQQLFKEISKNSIAVIRIYSKLSFDETNTHCLLGELELNLLDNESQDIININNHWLFINENDNESILYSEVELNESQQPDNEKYCRIKGLLLIDLWKSLSVKRYIQVILKSYDNNTLTVNIYLLKSAFLELSFPSEYNSALKSLAHIFAYFYNIELPIFNEDCSTYIDPEILYKAIQNKHKCKEYSNVEVQHSGLIPVLRQYQKSAVKWMLYQERHDHINVEHSLHPLYIEIKTIDGTVIYYNRYGGFCIKEKPLAIKPCPGGILADEMGLGKTVEILACILNNPRGKKLKDNSDSNINSIEINDTSNKCSANPDSVPEINIDNLNDCKESINKENHLSLNNIHEYTNKSIIDSINPFDTFKILTTSPNCQITKDEKIETKDNEIIYDGSRRSRRRKSVVKYNEYYMDDDIIDISKEDELFDISKEEESFDISKDEESYKKRNSRKKNYVDMSNEEEFSERRNSRKRSHVNYDEDDIDSFKPKRANKIVYNPEKEIIESTMKSIIDKVILENVWDGNINDYKKEGSYKEYRKFLKMRKKDPQYMMTLKERLNIQYNNSMASYSAVYALKPGAIVKDFFETKVKQKSYFECVCGNKDLETEDDLARIQCSICKLYQHAVCVHYDTKNLQRGEEYICPHCWSEQVAVISGATLIISPSSISYQWEEEIRKHLNKKSLNVFIYNGVAIHGYIQPKKLANYDIVLTTYEVLRRELNYVDLPHSNSEAGRRFRHPKRFMAIPSPLPCIDWWRICLDEAQMVECVTTKTAEMCHRLKGQNKWCVTGTPIQKSINDLQGLLMFLEVDPYCGTPWWQRCLYNPYCQGQTETLHELMSKFMWRTSKRDVLDQLGIPPSTEQVHWLKFNPVEVHFYKRLHFQCSSEATVKLNKFSNKSVSLKSLDRQTLSALLQPLLKLRQACNHPQVVKGQFTQLNKKTLTMEQILENLIKQTKLEAEEAHRIIIASLNGLAAIHIIKEEFVEAASTYREVLRAVEEEGKDLKTDLLQRLHTMHNLSELIQVHPENLLGRSLRDDSLPTEAKTLKEEYLKQYPQKIGESKNECVEQTQIIIDLKNRENFNFDWWLCAIEAVDQEFVQEVREELLSQYSRFQENKCILYPVESRVQLLRLLKVELKKMEVQRDEMIKAVNTLSQIEDYSTLLNGAIECHLRPLDNNTSKCILCVKHELFENLEETLFFVKDEKINRYTDTSKELMENIETLDALKRGNWGMSEVEKILKYVQTKLLGRLDLNIQEDSQTHLQILQHMKKEFKLYRIWWRSIYDYVSALDEVNMATLRYRLRLPGEEIPSNKKKKNDLEKKQTDVPTYIVEQNELPQLELKLKSDKIVNENDLKLKLGQMLYLNNLKKKGGSNSEPCPVCRNKLGVNWAVLCCGHSYCIECITLFLNQFGGGRKGSVKCPMCRQSTNDSQIHYINETETEETVKIIGSLSTKIEGVVRTVLKIKAAEPDAKILVFSSWTEVLDVIADGFTENGITFRLMNSRQKFQINLSSFKMKQEISVLLMPLSFGANGLNLVEAQHVILVEPILNPAAECQAIGRIHRIGQKRQTVVHRFIVRSTIEERMHEVLSSKANLVDDSLITIENLQELFTQDEPEENDELSTSEQT